jgi:hypothetical protein
MQRIADHVLDRIRQLGTTGITQKEISARTGVSQATISRIVGGSHRTSPQTMLDIQRSFANGEAPMDIVKRTNLDKSTVYRIIKGKTVGSRKVMTANG